MTQQKIGSSRFHWFLRGLLVGVMILAALNAASFVVRSGGWGSLLGRTALPSQDSIGFPMEVWQQGQHYGGRFVDLFAMFSNIGFGLLIGLVLGGIAANQASPLNGMLAKFESEQRERKHRPFQFSLGNLMIATVPVAIMFAAARTGRPEVLGAIYLFGPVSLVALAMLPRGLSWESRVVILTPMALSLIAFAVWVGWQLSMEFDKVMLGVFVFWVPQSTLGAIVITLATLYRERALPGTNASRTEA